MSHPSPHASASSEMLNLIEACQRLELTEWESDFITSLHKRRKPPTEKQMATLRRIASGGPDYKAIAEAARRALPEILARWIPDGKQNGDEYAARNPKRSDRSIGSFTVNTETGKWADFATGEGGGDFIALAAWLFDLSQPVAARKVADMLGMGDGSHG